MFLIPTYLAESPIHGIGVFTPKPLPAGTLIWEFHPGVDWRLTPEELERFPEPYQSQFRSYCYLTPEGIYIFCGDTAKFMNHSDTPNCDDPEGRFTITNRDIAAGEELTSDYRTFDMESAEKGIHLYADAVSTNNAS